MGLIRITDILCSTAEAYVRTGNVYIRSGKRTCSLTNIAGIEYYALRTWYNIILFHKAIVLEVIGA